jgi:tetratricopeptide (TPR) repeat protein
VTYQDFDLVFLRDQNGFRVRVENSPVGQAEGRLILPSTGNNLEVLLKHFQGSRHLGLTPEASADQPEMSLQQFGQDLFDSVFTGDVLMGFQRSLDEVDRQHSYLRIRLRFNPVDDSAQLLQLPWEYLFDPKRNCFLALSNETPIVRCLGMSGRIQSLAVTPPLKLLVMVSKPLDAAPLEVEREWAQLQEALHELIDQNLVILERIDPTMGALQRALSKNSYHVFHFIGHGGFDRKRQDGLLLLERAGRKHAVKAKKLGVLLHDHPSMRLVVLNACEGAQAGDNDLFAGTAQSLLWRGIPAVIAMQFPITDLAAIAFSREFYRAVSDGLPIDAALTESRKWLYTNGHELEWGIPVLYSRAPDGHIFFGNTTISSVAVTAHELLARLRPEQPAEPPIEQSANTASDQRTKIDDPPYLIARTEEWQALQTAWTQHKAILLIGEDGMGKTRRASDLAATRKPHLILRASPLESNDTHATLARFIVNLFEQHPEIELEPWLVQELCRILPAMGNPPAAMRSDQEKARFLEAITQVFAKAFAAGTQTLVLDDLHFADSATLDALLHAHREHWGNPKSNVRFVYVFRALPNAFREKLINVAATDQGLLLELNAMPEEDVKTLVQSLGLPNLNDTQVQTLSTRLAKATDGNPGLLLETIRTLNGIDAFANGIPEQIPLRTDLKELIQQRFKKVSGKAQSLGQCFVIGGPNLTLASKILRSTVIKLGKPLGELQEAQIVSKQGFLSEWVREAVLEDVPENMRAGLHQACAEALESMGDDAGPAQIAPHWAACGKPAKAAEKWRAAAQTAEATYSFVEATDLYRHASECFGLAKNAELELKMLKKRCDLMLSFDLGHEYLKNLDQMLVLAKTLPPYFLAGVLQARAEYHYRLGHGQEAEVDAKAGYEQAKLSGDFNQQTGLLVMLGVGFLTQKRPGEAISALQKALDCCERWIDDLKTEPLIGQPTRSKDEVKLALEQKGTILMNLGAAYSMQNQYAQAETHYDLAFDVYKVLKNNVKQANVYVNKGSTLRDTGRAEEAIVQFMAALNIYANTKMLESERRVRTQLAEAFRDRAEFSQALEQITTALELVTQLGISNNRVLEVRGHILMFLGQLQRAETDLQESLRTASNNDMKARVLFKLARLYAWQKHDGAREAIAQAQTHLEHTEDKSLLFQLALFTGLIAPLTQRLPHFEKSLEIAQQNALGGLEMIAHTRLAQTLLELDQATVALPHSQRANDLSNTLSPSGSYLGEVKLIHGLVLAHLNDPRAQEQVEQTRAWLLEVADQKVPPEFRDGFLECNPINQLIAQDDAAALTLF